MGSLLAVLDAIEDGEIQLPSRELEQAAPEAPKTDGKTERAALSEQYQAKFGKRPPNTMSVDAIKAKLSD